MAQTQSKDAYEVLKIADYRNYLFSRVAVTLGVNVLGPTVGWQIYEITQDPFALGLIGLAELPFQRLAADFRAQVVWNGQQNERKALPPFQMSQQFLPFR